MSYSRSCAINRAASDTPRGFARSDDVTRQMSGSLIPPYNAPLSLFRRPRSWRLVSQHSFYFTYFETHKIRALREFFNLLFLHSIFELPRKCISSSESSNICPSLPFSLSLSLVFVCPLTACMPLYYPCYILGPPAETRRSCAARSD